MVFPLFASKNAGSRQWSTNRASGAAGVTAITQRVACDAIAWVCARSSFADGLARPRRFPHQREDEACLAF